MERIKNGFDKLISGLFVLVSGFVMWVLYMSVSLFMDVYEPNTIEYTVTITNSTITKLLVIVISIILLVVIGYILIANIYQKLKKITIQQENENEQKEDINVLLQQIIEQQDIYEINSRERQYQLAEVIRNSRVVNKETLELLLDKNE